jgi:hypothetical protein
MGHPQVFMLSEKKPKKNTKRELGFPGSGIHGPGTARWERIPEARGSAGDGVYAMSQSRKKPAASDDAGEKTAVRTAHSAEAVDAVRKGCAEAAGKGKPLERPHARTTPGVPRNIFQEDYLPEHGQGFVEAVHRLVDLVSISEQLLRSDDEKLRHKFLEQLLDMAYGKDARAEALMYAQENEPLLSRNIQD